MTTKRHRHQWRYFASSGDGKRINGRIGFRCQVEGCDVQKWRPTSEEERRWLDDPQSGNIHRVWHAFVEAAGDRLRSTDQDEKLDLAEIAARFSGDGVIVLNRGCDDSHFAGSDLILVPHESRGHWMGVSVVYVPQCDGNPPAQFFLYPGHLNGLREALTTMAERQNRGLIRGAKWAAKRAARMPASMGGPETEEERKAIEAAWLAAGMREADGEPDE